MEREMKSNVVVVVGAVVVEARVCVRASAIALSDCMRLCELLCWRVASLCVCVCVQQSPCIV